MDLAAYFARIDYAGDAAPAFETLRELHLKHPIAIPFENLSTLIGDPVRLDVRALETKLVKQGRGGYCFEQNRLFAEILGQLGFSVRTLAARVVWNASYVNPRTHMVLLVDLDADCYLCDVGFGGVTLTGPLRFVANLEQETPHEPFRLLDLGGDEFEAQALFDGAWRPLYRFDLQEQLPVDYEVLNYYVATHPDSHFRTRLMAARPTPNGRYALNDNRLTVYRRGHPKQQRTLATIDEIKTVLHEQFRIDLPAAAELEAALGRLTGT